VRGVYRITIPLGLAALAVFAGAPTVARSEVDHSFGDNGIVDGPRGVVVSVAEGPGRKFFAVSRRVIRYRSDGTVDSSFGGPKGVPVADNLEVEAASVDEDGNLVIGGWTCCVDNQRDFFAARYLPNGTLDPSFGHDGIATADVRGRFDFANDMALTPNGKVVVAGSTTTRSNPNTRRIYFALVRFTASGRVDKTFGRGGRVLTRFPHGRAEAWAVTVQPDGKVVAAGDSDRSGNFEIARYQRNGELDPSFGGNGKVGTSFCDVGVGWCDNPFVSAVTLDRRGRIIVTGTAHRLVGDGLTETYAAAIARFRSDGSLSRTFSKDGKRVISAFGRGRGVASVANGDILVAGGGFALAALTNSGQLDRGFSHDGIDRVKGGRAWAMTAHDGRAILGGRPRCRLVAFLAP
jgi:uncharacterized delta-60 repeat protein